MASVPQIKDIPQVDLPEGTSGPWAVEKFVLREVDVELENLRYSMTPGGVRWRTYPGEYTRLTKNGVLWMSDVHGERYDHLHFVWRARGDVLITGLGLGMVVAACLEREEVRTVTVVELEEDVVALVAESLYRRYNAGAPRLFVHLADARTWHPATAETLVVEPHRGAYVRSPEKFDAVWHDVWVESSGDVYEEQKFLRRRYVRWLKPGGYQDAWRATHCRHAATGRW